MLRYPLIALLFVALAFPQVGAAQDNLPNELSCEVHRTYPSFSITKEKLKEASSLVDLNRYYKSSWVKEYISVEFLATYRGTISKMVSKNDVLGQAQKDFINRAEADTEISVRVRYLPDNNLKHNEPKEEHFSFKVDPDREASYVGGPQQLNQYLQEKVLDKIPEGSLKQYELAAVQFTVSEEGEIIDPHMVPWTSENEKVNSILLKAVRDMPCWEPAEFANGLKVKQDFVLMVGDKESCTINLLNIQYRKVEQ